MYQRSKFNLSICWSRNLIFSNLIINIDRVLFFVVPETYVCVPYSDITICVPIWGNDMLFRSSSWVLGEPFSRLDYQIITHRKFEYRRGFTLKALLRKFRKFYVDILRVYCDSYIVLKMFEGNRINLLWQANLKDCLRIAVSRAMLNWYNDYNNII